MSYKRHCCLQISLAGRDMDKLQCLQLNEGWMHQQSVLCVAAHATEGFSACL